MNQVNTASLPATGERFITEFRDESVAEHLHRYSLAVELCAGKDVIDIASGEGYGSNLLAGVAKTVVGVDVAQEAVNHASLKYARGNLKFVHGSASDIPLPSDSCDVVVSFETIEHHDKHEAMLSELRRVLRPDGLLIISTPERLNYSDRRSVKNKYHVKELYLDEFRELVQRHFSRTSFYFQQVLYGSVIVSEMDPCGFNYIQGNFSGCTHQAALPMHMYNICLASNAPLPTAQTSIFGASLEWSYAMQDKDDRIATLEQRLKNLQTTVQNLESSASFRVGRLVTSPLRLLAKRMLSK